MSLKANERFDIVGKLPIDIVAEVVKYIPRYTDLIHYQRVSKTWNQIFTCPETFSEGFRKNEYSCDDSNAYDRFVGDCYEQHSVLTLNLSSSNSYIVGPLITGQVTAMAYSNEYLALYAQHSKYFLIWDFSSKSNGRMEPYKFDFSTGRVIDMIISDKNGYLIWQESNKPAIFVFDIASALDILRTENEGKATEITENIESMESTRQQPRVLKIFPFPEGCRLSGISPFNCDGEHLVARFGVDIGSPKKFIMVWDIKTRDLVSKFPYTDSGMWDTMSIFRDNKIYLFSLPPRAEVLRLFPFPGYCKAYDLYGNVVSSVGVLPGTEMRYTRLFDPVCDNGKISYSISRQGSSIRGHCLSTMEVDEKTGIGKETKYYPNFSVADSENLTDDDDYYPIQECISHQSLNCKYLFHAIASSEGVSGQLEIWDTEANKSRRYFLPKVRAVYGNKSFFARFIDRELHINRFSRWDDHLNTLC
ncbi:hypothetical protein V1511DRAFT_489540 [Dipodascopsis uninucleata]